MTLRPINETFTSTAKNKTLVANNNKNNQQNLTSNPSFQGFNPVITLMDGIDRGGFAASFISQDFVGMAMPRIWKGMNRGRDVDEDGKKTGPYNWAFARKEGIREILSGPSVFIIPLMMLSVIKKYFGSANNVSVDMIGGLGNLLEKYAVENSKTLTTNPNAKQEFYERIFDNVLRTSTENMPEEEIRNTAKSFAKRTIDIENAKPKNLIKNIFGVKVKNSKQDLTNALEEDYMAIKKHYSAPSDYDLRVKIAVDGKNPLESRIRNLLTNMHDFTNDAFKSIKSEVSKNTDVDLLKSVKQFVLKRSGSRILTNLAMFSAVVGFFNIIPKLYNMGLKGNPAFKEELEAKKTFDETDIKQPTFTGRAELMTKATKNFLDIPILKKLSDKFEFDGASMSVPAMLTLLFGFCLPPRYRDAQDKYDRKEILLRDIASFTAILFAAKGLTRGFSVLFSKASGLALNIKPANHNKSIFTKLKNYLTPGNGIQVIKSEVLKSKYSNIDKYQGGINGFFKFIEENGGNVKKTLMLDKEVYKNANRIVGKDLKDANIDEIKAAFKDIKDNEALENIYEVFRNKNNKYINRAKTLNSSFDFASTIALVPLFMMWLARACENMTAKARAKDAELAKNSNTAPKSYIAQKQPSMEGFLKK